MCNRLVGQGPITCLGLQLGGAEGTVGVGSSDARRACEPSRPWSPWTRICVVPVGQLRWALTPWWWPLSSTLQALSSRSPPTPSWLLTESWGCTAAHTLPTRAGQFPVVSQVWAGVCTPVSMQNKPTSGCLPSLPPKPQIKTDLGGSPRPIFRDFHSSVMWHFWLACGVSWGPCSASELQSCQAW